MPKNRVLYNTVGAFIGCCPSTGFHFMDASGNIVNSIYSVTGNVTGYSNNLVNSLYRIYSASYGFNESRTDVKSLGQFGTISRPIITNPPVSLNLSYYFMGF